MKKLLWLLFLLLIPCAARAEGGLRIAVASDPHLLSPALVTDQERLLRIISAADGKVTHYTPEIVAAFVEEMLSQRPDCVVLSGDLTLNGGNESHRDLIAQLDRLWQAGIPVLAIPGNHDCTGKAYLFGPHGAQPVIGTNDAQFRKAYADFGLNGAIARDEASFSYTYALSDDLWLVMLDANTGEAPNSLREDTLRWLEDQLRAAQAAGARVIGVTHQNLLVHYAGFAIGFQIDNADRLAELYARYGVRLHLSGHMHLQHIGEEGGVTEIATSSLAVYPHHYGMITVSGDRADYAAQPLNVETWARVSGIEDENLLNFDAYSKAFFDGCNSGSQAERINALNIEDGEKAAMLEYSNELNRCIFAGRDPRSLDEAMLELWQKYLPGSFGSSYMRWMLDSVPHDMRQVSVSLR